MSTRNESPLCIAAVKPLWGFPACISSVKNNFAVGYKMEYINCYLTKTYKNPSKNQENSESRIAQFSLSAWALAAGE